MSTHANVSIMNVDKTVTAIYVHSDGYISWTGVRLITGYNTENKVRALLTLGNLSIVGYELGKKHTREENNGSHNKWCYAYGRDDDRTDEGDPSFFESKATFMNRAEEYVYLFDNDIWWVSYDAKRSPFVSYSNIKDFERLDLAILTERILT